MRLLRVIILLPVNHTMLRKHSISFYYTFFIFYYIFLATEVCQRCSINKTLLFTYSPLQLILYQILYLFFQNQTLHIYPNAYIQPVSLLAIIVFIPLRIPVNLIPSWRHIPMKTTTIAHLSLLQTY